MRQIKVNDCCQLCYSDNPVCDCFFLKDVESDGEVIGIRCAESNVIVTKKHRGEAKFRILEELIKSCPLETVESDGDICVVCGR